MRVLYLFLFTLLFGCGSGAYGKADAVASRAVMDGEGYSGGEAAPGAPAMEPMDAGGFGPSGGMLAQAPPAPPPPSAPPPSQPDAPPSHATAKVQPMLIYTATFHMAVFEAAQGLDAVKKLADDLGGYLVRRDDASITIRVPAAKYLEAQTAVVKLGDVLHRDETVEDVTEQFLDVQTRLKTKRAMQERLQQLLAQAKNVEEALAVERELARITEEIESMEGRLKVWRELVAFSTITVMFQARPADKIDSTVRLPFPWLDELGLSNLLSM
jgi:hypothetical protein